MYGYISYRKCGHHAKWVYPLIRLLNRCYFLFWIASNHPILSRTKDRAERRFITHITTYCKIPLLTLYSCKLSERVYYYCTVRMNSEVYSVFRSTEHFNRPNKICMGISYGRHLYCLRLLYYWAPVLRTCFSL